MNAILTSCILTCTIMLPLAVSFYYRGKRIRSQVNIGMIRDKSVGPPPSYGVRS